MGLQGLPDSDIDALLSASLRKTEDMTPKQQREVRERLLAAAHMPRPHGARPSIVRWMRAAFWLPLARWWYALLFEETRYDRARRLPERALANRWRARFMEGYLVIRPAY
jgi:predicted nucleotidyltransferase